MRTSLRRRSGKAQKVDVDMLNAVKSLLADISSVSPSSELCEGLTLETSANRKLFTAFNMSTSTHVDTFCEFRLV